MYLSPPEIKLVALSCPKSLRPICLALHAHFPFGFEAVLLSPNFLFTGVDVSTWDRCTFLLRVRFLGVGRLDLSVSLDSCPDLFPDGRCFPDVIRNSLGWCHSNLERSVKGTKLTPQTGVNFYQCGFRVLPPPFYASPFLRTSAVSKCHHQWTLHTSRSTAARSLHIEISSSELNRRRQGMLWPRFAIGSSFG